jgi:FKBP-type peptidyl-prolyl cis-trans isomerase 2
MPEDNVVEEGDTVKIHYTGIYNGEVFDTTNEEIARKAGIYSEKKEYSSLEILVGAGKVIKGLEEALPGMRLMEEKKVDVPPDKGFKDPNHPLFGKHLRFKIKVVDIFKAYYDVRVYV